MINKIIKELNPKKAQALIKSLRKLLRFLQRGDTHMTSTLRGGWEGVE